MAVALVAVAWGWSAFAAGNAVAQTRRRHGVPRFARLGNCVNGGARDSRRAAIAAIQRIRH